MGLTVELQLAGHDAVYAREIFDGRRTDGTHLLTATHDRRILIAYNRKHYILLNDAWKRWSDDWSTPQKHAGILCLSQGLPRDLYVAIDIFSRSDLPIINELYTYYLAKSWVLEPYAP